MSEPKPKSDVEVISMIKGSEKERREALQYFFKNPKLRLSVHKYVMMHGGNEADEVASGDLSVFYQVKGEKYGSKRDSG